MVDSGSARVRELDADIATSYAAIRDSPPELLGVDWALYGHALLSRYFATHDVADLDTAADAFRTAVELEPNPALRAGHWAMVGRVHALHVRWDPGHAGPAVDAYRAAIATAAPDGPKVPDWWMELADVLTDRYAATGRDEDIDEAIEIARNVIDAMPDAGDVEDQVDRIASLGNMLYRRYERFGDAADIAEAVAVGRRAADLAARDDPDQLDLARPFLATALHWQYQVTGESAPLDEAIDIYTYALATVEFDEEDRALCGHDYGLALLSRFARDGSRDDLDRGIDLLRAAVATGFDLARTRPLVLANIAEALRRRFAFTADRRDLDDACALARQAVAAPVHSPYRAAFIRATLAIVLGERFQFYGATADLDEAIDVLRETLAALPADHLMRTVLSGNLCVLLIQRHQEFRRTGDLDEAITWARNARIDREADRQGSVVVLTHLSLALQERYYRNNGPNDLDAALVAARAAVSAVSEMRTRPVAVAQLVDILIDQFRLRERVADIDEAASLAREMLAAHPADVRSRLSYAMVMAARFGSFGDVTDIREAVVAARFAAGMASATIGERMTAAFLWGRSSVIASGRIESGLDGLRTAVALLPTYAWNGVQRNDRERRLTKWPNLANDASASALATGDAPEAVTLLEAGRAVLWTQLLQTRTDLSALHARNAALANRLDELRSALDRPEERLVMGFALNAVS